MVVFKLAELAEKRFRRLNGHELIGGVIAGVIAGIRFADGEKQAAV